MTKRWRYAAILLALAGHAAVGDAQQPARIPRVGFVAAVPKELIAKGLKAGDWVREVAKVAGGGGGCDA